MLAAFFKVSCPVCQYAFPYLERIHKAHGDKKITIVGISQDNQRDTAAFLKEYGVTFQTLKNHGGSRKLADVTPVRCSDGAIRHPVSVYNSGVLLHN